MTPSSEWCLLSISKSFASPHTHPSLSSQQKRKQMLSLLPVSFRLTSFSLVRSMAGHSKWANIRHRKAAEDAKKNKIYTKFLKEIENAAAAGGADSIRVSSALERARSADVPKALIERAIKRGVGTTLGEGWEYVNYEGFGPAGTALMVQTRTDNRNRTIAEVRTAFRKHGRLGSSGDVAYLFGRKGFLCLVAGDSQDLNEESISELILESGADDFHQHGDIWEVTCAKEDFQQVENRLNAACEAHDLSVVESGLYFCPNVRITDDALSEEDCDSFSTLVSSLYELRDVEFVAQNGPISYSLRED